MTDEQTTPTQDAPAAGDNRPNPYATLFGAAIGEELDRLRAMLDEGHDPLTRAGIIEKMGILKLRATTAAVQSQVQAATSMLAQMGSAGTNADDAAAAIRQLRQTRRGSR